MDFSFLRGYYVYFFTGTANTVILALFTVFLGVIIGTFIALMKISRNKVLSFIATAYVEFIRGTPLMVQLFIIYYGIPLPVPDVTILGMDMSRFIPGVMALSINSGAYVAEIIRAGIQAIDRGQMEAARSLGLTHSMAMRYIILPQALRNILPALGNEFVVVIKESSIVSIVGIADLMFNTNVVRGALYKPMEPLMVAALIYFILTFTLSKLLGKAERRMRSDD
ncbi:MAG TPA: amino acid ABC transporter permease [Clostridiaceae bacterium]|nr:amino acid ABC transporter permease [Clostridiaceae bacterium]